MSQAAEDLRDLVTPQVRTGRREDPAHDPPTLARDDRAVNRLLYYGPWTRPRSSRAPTRTLRSAVVRTRQGNLRATIGNRFRNDAASHDVYCRARRRLSDVLQPPAQPAAAGTRGRHELPRGRCCGRPDTRDDLRRSAHRRRPRPSIRHDATYRVGCASSRAHPTSSSCRSRRTPRSISPMSTDSTFTSRPTATSSMRSATPAREASSWLTTSCRATTSSALRDYEESRRLRAEAGLSTAWHGDVFIVLAVLRDHHPELAVRVIVGSGNEQAVIWNQEPSRRPRMVSDTVVAGFRDLGFRDVFRRWCAHLVQSC